MKGELGVSGHRGAAVERGVAPSYGQATLQDSRDVARLARGAGVSVFSKLAGRCLVLAGQVLLARLLGAEIFGLYVLGWTLLRVLGVLVPLGLDNGIIHFGSAYWGRDHASLRRLFRQALALALSSGLLAGAALYALAPWLAQSV